MTIKPTLSLKGYFLIAMPEMEDELFANSLVYIHDHNASGALGVIVNKPTDITLDKLMSQLNLPLPKDSDYIKDTKVMLGGPVDHQQGLILYEDDTPEKNIQLSSSQDVLIEATEKKIKPNMLISLGYSTWDAGQLETELSNGQENGWLLAPADCSIIFNLPPHLRRRAAALNAGIKLHKLSREVGHA